MQLQVLEELRRNAAQAAGAFPETTAALLAEIATLAETFGSRREQAASAVQQVCDRLECWPQENLAPGDLARALQRTYRRGRKSFRATQSDPTTENFHSWRKRVKDLYYQAQILRELHPGLRAAAGDAKALGRRLRDLHDLAFSGKGSKAAWNFRRPNARWCSACSALASANWKASPSTWGRDSTPRNPAFSAAASSGLKADRGLDQLLERCADVFTTRAAATARPKASLTFFFNR